MAWTIANALADESIKVIRRRTISEYQFTVGKLKTVITIRIYTENKGSQYLFEQSHAIKTPSQAGPYWTSKPWADYEAYAVHRAISGITDYYKAAVKAGHKPVESWLVPNKRFVKFP